VLKLFLNKEHEILFQSMMLEDGDMLNKQLLKKIIHEIQKRYDKGNAIPIAELESLLPEGYLEPEFLDQLILQMEYYSYRLKLFKTDINTLNTSTVEHYASTPTRSSLSEIGRKRVMTTPEEYVKFEEYYQQRAALVKDLLKYEKCRIFLEAILHKHCNPPDYPFAAISSDTTLTDIEAMLNTGQSINWHPRFLGELINIAAKIDASEIKPALQSIMNIRLELIERNLRLVTRIAQSYDQSGIYLFDLIQEGTRGLIKAIERFDHRKKYRLGNLASWWIKKFVRRGITTERSIRLPEKLAMLMPKITEYQATYRAKHFLDPTPEQIAHVFQIPPETVIQTLEAKSTFISFDQPIESREKITIGESIADSSRPGPDESAITTIEIDELRRMLIALPEREQFVIKMRFGLDDGVERTLAEIGTILRITRERVRQIEKRALQRLRAAWQT